MIQVCNDEAILLQNLTTHASQTSTPALISELLDQFDDIFEGPTQLPPMREGKGKLVVERDNQLRQDLLTWMFCTATGGHSGRHATLQRIKVVVYWRGMTRDVQDFVKKCTVCQQNKYETTASPRLLQPLPIPGHVWQHISMNFIEGLPQSVVDRLSRAAHFMTLTHPYTAFTIAQSFLDNVFRLHGFLESIVSDRDLIFISKFWQEIMACQGVQLRLSSVIIHKKMDNLKL
uniref:Transposon Ty3-I Gag-Pol polyprotein n=2 Tax=Cajanus cajan TaxID=3821 RepID=A0A151TH21_CAJCA|nr:Transposon Ty3-I Gag-Pol polyprotein [Cajanus cajan]